MKQSEKTINDNEYLDQATSLVYCSKCHTPKQMRLTGLSGQEILVSVPCECKQQQNEADMIKQTEEAKEDNIRKLRIDGIQDPLYREADFAKADRQQPAFAVAERYVRNFPAMRETDTGLLLWGGVGTGKTYLAACIANALIDREVPVKMRSVAGCVNDMWSGVTVNRNSYLKELNRCTLLILDDFGSERDTSFMNELLYQIIDSRYRSGKPMILTTNLSLENLRSPQTLEQERISSRILENCVPVFVDGSNKRLETAAEKLQRAKALLQ